MPRAPRTVPGEALPSQHGGARAGREAPPAGHTRKEREAPAPRSGHTRVGREGIAGIQRRRVLSAAISLAAEEGAARLTAGAILDRAGLSRRTFYELFTDRDDCLLAAFEDGVARVCAEVLPAWQSQGSWVERVRASLASLLTFLDDEPLTARLLVVQSPACGPAVIARRQALLSRLASAIDEGRALAKAPPSSLAAEGVVGGALAILYARLQEPARGGGGAPPPSHDGGENAPALLTLTSPLTAMIALPYLGSAASRRELERPAPARAPGARVPAPEHPSFDPLPIRLTHRTVCVLTAIGDSPGASNRDVGAAADIFDQGQISKLLRRLQGHGLIANRDGARPFQGERNAWTLTPRGAAIVGLARPGGVVSDGAG